MIQLEYPVSKSHMAFIFAVGRMFHYSPKVYMWTLTFPEVHRDEWCMMRYAQFADKMRRSMPWVWGIRVVEVHPGRNLHGLSHGLHFHFLINHRVSVHWIRREAEHLGFGRVHVRQVKRQEALYLGKYLTKGQPDLAKGSRRWGSINWPDCNRKNDIVVNSQFHRNFRKVQDMVKVERLTPDIVHTVYRNTKFFGPISKWPIEKYYYSERSRKLFEKEDWRAHLGHKEGNAGTGKMSPRRDKLTREQSMVNIATRWRLLAGKIAKRRNLPAAGEKFLKPTGASPQGNTGETPVKKRDYVLDTTGYDWDKIRAKQLGIGLAAK